MGAEGLDTVWYLIDCRANKKLIWEILSKKLETESNKIGKKLVKRSLFHLPHLKVIEEKKRRERIR